MCLKAEPCQSGVLRLLGDNKDGLVDLAVVYRIDRQSRSLAEFAKLVEEPGRPFCWKCMMGSADFVRIAESVALGKTPRPATQPASYA